MFFVRPRPARQGRRTREPPAYVRAVLATGPSGRQKTEFYTFAVVRDSVVTAVFGIVITFPGRSTLDLLLQFRSSYRILEYINILAEKVSSWQVV